MTRNSRAVWTLRRLKGSPSRIAYSSLNVLSVGLLRANSSLAASGSPQRVHQSWSRNGVVVFHCRGMALGSRMGEPDAIATNVQKMLESLW